MSLVKTVIPGIAAADEIKVKL